MSRINVIYIDHVRDEILYSQQSLLSLFFFLTVFPFNTCLFKKLLFIYIWLMRENESELALGVSKKGKIDQTSVTMNFFIQVVGRVLLYKRVKREREKKKMWYDGWI